MKPSRYNHFIHTKHDNKILAYNCRSGGLAVVEPQNYEFYCKFIECTTTLPTSFGQDTRYSEFISKLQAGCFLVDDYPDELDQLELLSQLAKFDTTIFGLTIAPTLSCNLNCIYCYERKKDITMDTSVQQSVINFVEQGTKTARMLSVTWYGGEPLLCINIVERLSSQFMDICQQQRCEYSASIVTNGYLLSQRIIHRLKELKIQAIQITLDGPESVHNRRRPLKSGEGSYRRIVDNICAVIDIIPISIRVNIDKTLQIQYIDELLSELNNLGLNEKLKLYFGNVDAATEVCQNISQNCYDNRAFSQREIELYRKVLDHGFYVDKLPQPRSVYCSAVMLNSFLIDPNGGLYKCWNDIGNPDKSFGYLNEPIRLFHPNFYKWIKWNPIYNSNCRECNILPLCLGGCPDHGLKNNITENCDSWKYNLHDMLELIAISKLHEREKKKVTSS